MLKHRINVAIQEDGTYIYKDIIVAKTGTYRMHKEISKKKKVPEKFQALEALQYSLNCLYHDVVIAKRMKPTDDVIIYFSGDGSTLLEILNSAKMGKKAYGMVKNVKDGEERKRIIQLIKSIQSIFLKSRITIKFKALLKGIELQFNSTKWYSREKIDSHILESANKRTDSEKQELRARFSKMFQKRDLNYNELIGSN